MRWKWILGIAAAGAPFPANSIFKPKKNQADLETKIIVEKINLAEMLSKLGIARDLDGVLDVSVNLKGRGDSVAALMAGLNGDVIAVLTEAHMLLKYLSLVGADLMTSFLKIMNPFEKKIDNHLSPPLQRNESSTSKIIMGLLRQRPPLRGMTNQF